VLDKLAELSGGVNPDQLPPDQARLAPTFADAVQGVQVDRGLSTAPKAYDKFDKRIDGYTKVILKPGMAA